MDGSTVYLISSSSVQPATAPVGCLRDPVHHMLPLTASDSSSNVSTPPGEIFFSKYYLYTLVMLQ